LPSRVAPGDASAEHDGMTRPLRLAGALAVVLSLWLSWYEVRIPDALRRAFDPQNADAQLPEGFAAFARGLLDAIPTVIVVNGWQALEGADVALALLAGAVAFSVMLDVHPRAILGAAAAIAGIVVVHVLDRPGPSEIVSLKIGPWVALGGAVAIALSARAQTAPTTSMSSSPEPWAPPPAASDAWAPAPAASVPPPRSSP
jgi:hypothetical protein